MTHGVIAYFRKVKLSLTTALPGDAAGIAAVMNEAAQHLTLRYGKGHWSYEVTEKTVKTGISPHSKVLLAKEDNAIVGTLRLTIKKPWAIDPSYFTKVLRPVYLVDMAVRPDMQRKKVGEFMLREAKTFAVSWLAEAIRLDAYDHEAGAGEFYHKCGFTEKGRVVYRKSPLIYFEWLT
jgi:GNAT superfamily N-acetyltransferase